MAKINFQTKQENPQHYGVWDIDPSELDSKRKEVCIVDVRGNDEYVGELGHIPEAQLLVLDQLPEKLNNLPKDQTVVFVCRSGGRSGRAAAFALQNGYTDVYNMKGGMLLWNDLKLETAR
jgi:hydroxyacylglutathione hydrolase